MESYKALDYNFGKGLNISTEIRDFLHEAARWAYVLSILGFIMVGFFIVVAIFAGTFISIVMSESQNDISGFPSAILTVIYLVIAGINVFPVLYLYRFAQNTKHALRSDNQTALVYAFENLRSHYRFIGIFAIIIIGFYTLIFIFSIFASVAL